MYTTEDLKFGKIVLEVTNKDLTAKILKEAFNIKHDSLSSKYYLALTKNINNMIIYVGFISASDKNIIKIKKDIPIIKDINIKLTNNINYNY